MYTAKIENVKGDVIKLTGNESQYQVISIIGLNPPNAQINTTAGANLDGASFNSSRLETRNIVITIKLNGDVEANRNYLYKFFPTKQWCKFYYTNELRDVYIEGYVESCECDFFTNAEIMQVSLICPQPYFKDIDEIINDMSSTVAMFYFPFAINVSEPIPFSEHETTRITNVYNDSDSESGIIIEINLSSDVNEILIRNIDNGETFTLNYSFEANDIITINTNRGEKSATLLRDGSTTNLFPAIQKGSTFFQLALGDNSFGYLVDDGENNEFASVVIKHNTLYRGV